MFFHFFHFFPLHFTFWLWFCLTHTHKYVHTHARLWCFFKMLHQTAKMNFFRIILWLLLLNTKADVSFSRNNINIERYIHLPVHRGKLWRNMPYIPADDDDDIQHTHTRTHRTIETTFTFSYVKNSLCHVYFISK